MMGLDIEGIELKLYREAEGVRVRSGDHNVIFSKQTIDEISRLIRHNFSTVSEHYKSVVGAAETSIDLDDIRQVSLKIVLHYLYMYNSWRSIYRKLKNKRLEFDSEDYGHPQSHDIIFEYFKKKYPNDWKNKCAALLGMNITEVTQCHQNRQDFHDMF